MQLVDSLDGARLRQETILTIGTFDGVHRGHQALIGAVIEQARATGRLAALVTFHPHPSSILAPERAPRILTSPSEKLALLKELGLDLVALLRFSRELAAMPPRAFMEKVASRLHLRELWVGADFVLGRDRAGDVPRLRELGRELGYKVTVLETVSSDEQAISSSHIRSLLKAGRIEEATALLGRYPGFAGKVLPGLETIELNVDPERAMPSGGVFAAFAAQGSERVPALASFGGDLSLAGNRRTVGIQLLAPDRTVQGCELAVELVSRLRDATSAQIETDREALRRILDQARERASAQAAPPEAHRYWFREREHTADRALSVWGKDLADLLVGAARGMLDLMGDLEGVAPQAWRTIRLEAEDREGLLVEWLNELLFIAEQEGLMFTDFCLESLREPTARAQADPTPATIAAHVGGAVAPITKAHIKAATYHDLELVEDETGWSATITFDV